MLNASRNEPFALFAQVKNVLLGGLVDVMDNAAGDIIIGYAIKNPVVIDGTAGTAADTGVIDTA